MSNSSAQRPLLVIFGILFIASALRAPITGVGPILEVISHDLNLSPTFAGLITTLPLIAFAIFSPISSSIARKTGLELALMLALILITFGLALRSLGTIIDLYIGTAFIGVGIAFGNVLLPSLIKRDFPQKVTTITSLYVLMMGLASTLSASTAYPIMASASDWHFTSIPSWGTSLATVMIFPLLAILLWIPQLRNHTKPSKDTSEIDSHSYLWRSIEAWQVTAYLAINSFMMYILISWLPSVLVEKGYSESEAGFLHGMLQLATAIPAIVLIPLMAKIKDKRGLAGVTCAWSILGLLGLILLPQLALFWVFAIGFSLGGGFILSLSLIGLKTQDAHQAAALSGMAQCVGYLLASTGPILFGALHEQFHSWHIPLVAITSLSILWTFIAFIASKPQLIQTKSVN